MTKLRDELVANNNKINWYPDTIRTGRFGKFLENVIDWGISRDRYWGTPLPIWTCECGHQECIGSIAELKEKGINIREKVSKENIVVRWTLYYILILIIIVFGAYGFGYAPVDPIYANF